MAFDFSQTRTHVEVTSTPANVALGLPDGSHVLYVRSGPAALWARRATAPTDPNDFIIAPGKTFVPFGTGPDSPPLWVRSDPAAAGGETVRVLVASR